MSRGDISLGRRIRTSTAAQPHFPVFIDTVEDAIDHVQELPRQVADRSHWIAARDALWQASDDPMDYAKIKAADAALCRALAAEGWLNDLKPF
jgi:hypothetical protein